jgi:ABC-type multidrug transport system ATPase subunit
MIITTHMMLEADTLCDRIAIVSEGRLKVIGNQRELKHSLGDGFMLQVTLVGSNQADEDRAIQFAKDRLHPDATLRAKQAKTLFINVPRDLKLDEVFRALYSKERVEIGGINHFIWSECPLEAIFLLFGQRD